MACACTAGSFPAATGRRRPLVLAGGNAEEVSWMLEFGTVFTGWDLVLLNYRGWAERWQP
ncbi:MAG: hypothetical protein IPI57_13630 [Candidatus Competibacteraceae bacterium]|nr:hypothetical protein [Candidatus Competibacteraceae bacterium]